MLLAAGRVLHLRSSCTHKTELPVEEKKKKALIPLARDPGDTVNLHPKAKHNPGTLALPDVDTTEKLYRWWGLGSAQEEGRGVVEMLGMSGGGLQEKAEPGTRYQRVSRRE